MCVCVCVCVCRVEGGVGGAAEILSSYYNKNKKPTLHIFPHQRYVGWSCVLNCFMLSSLIVLAIILLIVQPSIDLSLMKLISC